jgi:hypothetical protein
VLYRVRDLHQGGQPEGRKNVLTVKVPCKGIIQDFSDSCIEFTFYGDSGVRIGSDAGLDISINRRSCLLAPIGIVTSFVNTSPGRRRFASLVRLISVVEMSGIPPIWLLTKWANQRGNKLDYICVLSGVIGDKSRRRSMPSS